MKKLKTLFLLLCAFSIAIFSAANVHAAEIQPTLASQIDVSLEYQENTDGTKIRYVSTITPLEDLSSVTKIDIKLTISKDGEDSRQTTITTTKVYDEIQGTNGKAKKENTYYSVYTITELKSYSSWTLGATFEYFYSDNSYDKTNEVSYTIPAINTSITTGTGSFDSSSSIEDCFNASSIENGNIFHAWNWSMTTIEENLDNIKNAGYTTIQTSPMQPQKDYYPGNKAFDAWWKLYQPLGFSIATKDNQLGSKDDLVSMVNAAHSKGLKVIVDVVANHLAGNATYTDDKGVWHDTQFADAVKTYEPEIYGSNGKYDGKALIHYVNGGNTAASDSNNTTDGHIGMPDLDTSNSTVQERVLSLLKEYIDCNVDGFRFDAAKHIETNNQSEPNTASNFWPYVLGGATSYARDNGKDDPYYYGEILNGCGNGRSYSWYTDLGMDVIANKCGNELRSNFNDGKALAYSSYNPANLAGEYCIVWAESHDTYANDEKESPYVSIYNINKAYALMGSRNGAKALYLARPTDTTGYDAWKNCTTVLGKKGSEAFKLKEVTAVNKFRNYWQTEAEYVGNSSDFSYVIRYNSLESGMVLVNSKSYTNVSNVEVNSNMADGSYKDLVSGNIFTVSNGKVSGTMDSSCIAVLYKETNSEVEISDNISNTFYTDTETVTYTIKNAVSATLTVNGTTTNITSGATLTFGSDMPVGSKLTVTIKAIDSNNQETTKVFTYEKVKAPTVYTLTLTKPEDWSNKVYAYMYDSTTNTNNSAWPGVLMTKDSDQYTITFDSNTSFDKVIFTDGTYQTESFDLTLANASFEAKPVTTINFQNDVNWGDVYVYMWNHTTQKNNAEWPGVKLDNTYTFEYNSSYDRIIFNNNADQTKDLVLNPYIKTYIYDGTNVKYIYNIVKNSCVEHDWDLGVITKDATCTTDGVKTYTCLNCGETKDEKIPALGHDFDYSKAPEFTWVGYQSATAEFTCKNDSTHKDVVTAVITSSTLGNVITYTATVEISGYTYTSTKTNDLTHTHTYTHVEAKDSTCSQTGNLEYYYCEECDTYFDVNYEETTLALLTIAKKEHQINPGIYSIDDLTCALCHEVVEYEVNTLTIYCLVDSSLNGWNTSVNVYYWPENSLEWPGTPMEKEGTLTYNNKTYTVYSYTFTEAYANVIFNIGLSGPQTVDLTITSDANCYIITTTQNGKYLADKYTYIPESN